MTAEKTPFPREGSFFMERNGKPGETVSRDRGGAFQYSRRGLRLRRRGAYGIHRASGPRCQGLCRKVASLRSGGRRLAVRTAMEHPIGVLPRTPFPASRDFPSRGNERYEGKTGSHTLHVPFRSFPLWWLAPPPCPVGSMSLDSRVAYSSPMNPVPLPPPQAGAQ